MLRSISVVVLALVTAACASTHIFPMEDGSYLISANSASESVAQDQAYQKAYEYCASQGRQFVLIGKNSQYQGVDKNAKAVIGAVGYFMAPRRHGYYGYGMPYSTASHDDYRVEMQFRCR